MDDYIRRDDAVKIAEKYGLANGSVLGRHTGLADCIASEISSLPAADVAEVVRCKDCIYRIEGRCFSRTSFINAPAVEPDNFCSWGATE